MTWRRAKCGAAGVGRVGGLVGGLKRETVRVTSKSPSKPHQNPPSYFLDPFQPIEFLPHQPPPSTDCLGSFAATALLGACEAARRWREALAALWCERGAPWVTGRGGALLGDRGVFKEEVCFWMFLVCLLNSAVFVFFLGVHFLNLFLL